MILVCPVSADTNPMSLKKAAGDPLRYNKLPNEDDKPDVGDEREGVSLV